MYGVPDGHGGYLPCSWQTKTCPPAGGHGEHSPHTPIFRPGWEEPPARPNANDANALNDANNALRDLDQYLDDALEEMGEELEEAAGTIFTFGLLVNSFERESHPILLVSRNVTKEKLAQSLARPILLTRSRIWSLRDKLRRQQKPIDEAIHTYLGKTNNLVYKTSPPLPALQPLQRKVLNLDTVNRIELNGQLILALRQLNGALQHLDTKVADIDKQSSQVYC